MKEIINCKNPKMKFIQMHARAITHLSGNKKVITDGDLMSIEISAKAILECLNKLDKGE